MRRGLGRGQRGLTLLELVIAIVVLAIGSMAALRGVDQSRRGIGQDSTRMLAQIVAQNRAEELRLLGPAGRRGLPAQVPMGPHVFQVTVETAPTAGGLTRARIVARALDGPGAILVTFLPPRGAGG